MTIHRWYLRCSDCLSIVAIDEDPGNSRPECVACGGIYESMGRVRRDGFLVVGTREETPCDERCTAALGPKCNCQCGAANHGTGRVVVIERTAGKAPRVRPPDALAPERAVEFRRELALAESRIPVRCRMAAEAKARGEWIAAWSDYLDWQRCRRDIAHAKGLRTQRARIAALRRNSLA